MILRAACLGVATLATLAVCWTVLFKLGHPEAVWLFRLLGIAR